MNEATVLALLRFFDRVGIFLVTPVFLFLLFFVLANAAECHRISIAWGLFDYVQRPLDKDATCRPDEATDG